MPVSKKPRRHYRDRTEPRGPNPYTRAGTLLYSFYELAALARRAGKDATIDQIQRHARRKERTRLHTKFATVRSWIPAGPDSREAKRRRRQTLTQHPSVVARFANHPTRAQIEATAQEVEKKTGLVAKAKRALSPRRTRPAVA